MMGKPAGANLAAVGRDHIQGTRFRRGRLTTGRSATGSTPMFTRHALVAAAALCALVPALAQDTAPSSSTGPLRATGAYPIRQDMSQWLGSNLIGAKVVSASQERI